MQKSEYKFKSVSLAHSIYEISEQKQQPKKRFFLLHNSIIVR